MRTSYRQYGAAARASLNTHLVLGGQHAQQHAQLLANHEQHLDARIDADLELSGVRVKLGAGPTSFYLGSSILAPLVF